STVENVRQRIANDHVAFVAYVNGQPAAFGWMARGKATIGELNHGLILPEGHRYLWNFRTLPAFRGRGLYPYLLQWIIRYERGESDRFWIIHAPENHASRQGIIKAGFEYVGQLYLNEVDNAAIQVADAAEMYEPYLDYMGLAVSYQSAASCWNCSSPYLKNKSAACCCAPTGEVCYKPAALVLN
ncbi:MAG TPA: GNAT family N-acetyltransferase, partial [Flavisolibacter sp.]|nr:GNAT family N-acetyltransferase [Flavisolibacter sp.]